MASIQIDKFKDKKSRVFKLIPRDVVQERRKRNLQGRLPSLSCHKKYYKAPKSTLSLNGWPAIYDQGQIGSCTANAFCGCYKYLCPDKSFEPSRLYVYYKERLLENPSGPITDSGAFVGDAYNWVSRHGVCPESVWPYDINKVNDAPPSSADDEAVAHEVKGFLDISIDSNLTNSIAWCLLQNKPVMMAFGVYSSFMKIGSDGLCPVPNPVSYEDFNDSVDPYYGGHEVAIIGFDDDKQLYTVANSWGVGWGCNGFFFMPYSFVNNSNLVYGFSALSNTNP